MKVDFVVFIHRLYSNNVPKFGGLDMVLEQLIIKDRAVVYVEAPLTIKENPFITVTLKSTAETKKLAKFPLSSTPILGRIHELLLLLFIPVRFGLHKKTFITSDPLTSLAVTILKFSGVALKIYYHCIDYSETRFHNKAANAFYKLLFWFSLKHADVVGCVTKRIENILNEKGISHTVYVPNSPSMSAFAKYRKELAARTQYNLVVTCAGVSEKYRIMDTIKLVEKLLPDFPETTLTVIGSIAYDAQEYARILEYLSDKPYRSKIHFVGQIEKEKNLELVSKAWVGLAFYDKSHSHVNFGDSLKIREYAALGIPIVSDKTTPTSLEMDALKAGFAVEEPCDAHEAIYQLFADNSAYTRMSQAALDWAYSVDKDKIIDSLIATVESGTKR